jgi:hypothetical protein
MGSKAIAGLDATGMLQVPARNVGLFDTLFSTAFQKQPLDGCSVMVLYVRLGKT